MFWGRGDSSKLDQDGRQVLEHLRRLSETGHIIALDPAASQTALNAIEFFRQWESVLKLFTSFRNIALLVGALLTIYWATSGWVVTVIRDVAAGGN